MWQQLVWFVVTTIISIALAPKPKAPRQAAIDDFEFPTAEEGRPIPVAFGTVRIAGPNVLWYGDLRTTKIKKSSGFSSQTVGYKYYIGFHCGICYGPVDRLSAIDWGEKLVWSSADTIANTSDVIFAPNAFGGESREGGVWVDFDVCFGEDSQTANPYLVSKMGPEIAGSGGSVPAFRGIFGFVAKAGYIGTAAYVKPIAFTLTRILKGWQGGAAWYPDKAVIENETGSSLFRDMNPAHIVYQVLTDTEWGMGIPTSMINDAAFRDSADYYFAKGYGLSLLWNQAATIEEFLRIVVSHAGGSLALRNDTAQYEFMPVALDYDVDEVPVLGPAEIKEIADYQRPGLGGTVNEVTLIYTDPITFKDTTVVAQDLGNVEAQGARIPAIVEYRGIRSHAMARDTVAREHQARVTPTASFTLIALRSAWRLKYNSVFVLNWPAQPVVDNLPVRVLSINRGKLGKSGDGYITVKVVQDIYAEELGRIISSSEQTSEPDPVPTPADDPDPGIGVISTTQNDPPGDQYAGDRFFIPLSPPATGAWAGHEGEFAEPDDNGGWIFTPAADGTFLFDASTGTTYQVQGGVLTIPWTPPIPSMDAYPYTAVDPDDVALAGYSTADAQFYKIPVNLLPSGGGGASDAIDVAFDNSGTTIAATDVQNALDELDGDVQSISSVVAGILSDYGAPNGLAELDGAGKVPIAQLPDTVVGAVDYQGTWNANTNTPNLAGSSPSKGDYFVVSVAGTTSLGGISSWDVNDWAIYNGTAWEKVDNSNGTGAVTSVAGKTGVVTLVTADLTDAGGASGAAVLDAGARLPVNQQTLLVPVADATTTRTLQAADYFTVTRFSNGSAIALTVPANATLAVPIGMVCGYRVAGAGMVTVTGAGGVTINIPAGKTAVSSGTGAFIALHKVGTNEWDLSGNLA